MDFCLYSPLYFNLQPSNRIQTLVPRARALIANPSDVKKSWWINAFMERLYRGEPKRRFEKLQLFKPLDEVKIVRGHFGEKEGPTTK